jgi:o-succinylbenzoate synthase
MSDIARFDRIDVHRLCIPLVTPYRLAFGPVDHFDTIVVEITDRDGRVGLGEATVLTGYTDETIDDSWRVAREFASQLATMDAGFGFDTIATLGARYPFTATAFGSALEMLAGSAALEVRETIRVPVLGLLNAEREEAIAAEFEQLLAAGFRTIKVKVGIDAVRDAQRVHAVQRVVAGRARIRVDANQGYTADEGVAFVEALDPADIELFEQPCAAGDWDAHLAVAHAASVPMMLDESIYGLEDIDRAAELGAARYIKVKLMKLGTLERLAAAIARINALGMRAVLGNGVACDLGCWMEACVAARAIDNAGEMNGFLKARSGLLTAPLEFDGGAIVLKAGFAPRLDHARIAPYCLDFAGFPRTGAAIAVRETSQ